MRTFRVIGRFCSGAATVILYVASILVVLSAAALTATPMLACALLIATIGCISIAVLALVVLVTMHFRPWRPALIGPERLELPVLFTPTRSLCALAAIAVLGLVRAMRRHR